MQWKIDLLTVCHFIVPLALLYCVSQKTLPFSSLCPVCVCILQIRKTRNILYAFNAAASSCRRASFLQLVYKFVQSPQSQYLFGNSLI